MNAILPAAVAAAVLAAGSASAADYVTIPLEATVDRPAEVVWRKVSGWCDIGPWLKTTCVVTSGVDQVGSVRRIADRIDEVMVARTAFSYTYAQPKSPIDYHGTVEVRPDGARRSKILYTLIYDAESLKTPEAKQADRDRRAKQFTAIVQTMKTLAEAK
ncbi:MAG: SRPBCC family protein [Phenylobacterium sp.]